MVAINRHVDMDEFDKLVLRAALVKRKDIIERYGDDGCDKLLAKGARRVKKMTFDSTILELLEGMDAYVWYRHKMTKNNPKKQAWCRDCSDEVVGCNIQSRRHSMNV